MSCTFNTILHGKWILAGEHAVLRHHQAIIFPVASRQFDLSYESSNGDLQIEYQGNFVSAPHDIVKKIIGHACQLLKRNEPPRGKLVLHNSVPMGAGMGASAVLCVAMSQWLSALGWISSSDIFSFACQLENLFHGESSGADIAVILNQKPIIYQREKQIEPLCLNWCPRWYLSYCGQSGLTVECLKKVKKIFDDDPARACDTDKTMQNSVELAISALQSQENIGIHQLIQAIDQASLCFRDWGLVSEALDLHMSRLKSAGALAIKPTGSGNGGFVISLWAKDVELPQEIDFIKI